MTKVFVYMDGSNCGIGPIWSIPEHVFSTPEQAADALLAPVKEGYKIQDERSRNEIIAELVAGNSVAIGHGPEGCFPDIRAIHTRNLE